MTLTRRTNANAAPPAASRERSGSTIWEDEANQYWQAMEPTAKRRGRPAFLRALLVVTMVCGTGGLAALALRADSKALGVNFGGGIDAWLRWSSSLSARFLLPTVNINGSEAAATVPNSMDMPIQPVPGASANSIKMVDQAAMEQLRARCRVRGVQTRWHEETCRKMCLRDPHQSACMNGCSYGSITVTKLTCDELASSEAYPSSSMRCPDGVSCAGACRAYDSEKPFPAMRNACERGCANVVPAACARVLQIYRDLERGAIQ